MDHHLEQENHKLREEVTTLRAENEILRNLVSLMTVAQSRPFSVVSTQAQTVASTMPISTVFASTPQHAMLKGYLWSTPLSSGEICNTLFYLFNYLIEFRVFLNNSFDLW